MPHTLGNQIILFFHGCRDDFSIGECYEVGRYVDQDLETARAFYSKAANQGDMRVSMKFGELYERKKEYVKAVNAYGEAARLKNMEAKKHLLELTACTLDGSAEYILGELSEDEKEWKKAGEWYEKSAHKQNKDALNFLVSRAGLVVELTQEQKGPFQSHSLQNDGLAKSDILFHLARVYEERSKRIPDDIVKAWECYVLSAKEKHLGSLARLEKIAVTDSSPIFPYALAEIYHLTFNNFMKAAQWYKKAANQECKPALKQLREIASQNAQVAYAIAQSYEKDAEEKKVSPQFFLEFYGYALRSHHDLTKKRIEVLANAQNSEAQYMLGEYALAQNKRSDAAQWWMKAVEQKHEKAAHALLETSFTADEYFEISVFYDRIMHSLPQALSFCTKASELGHVEASFRLGQYYETGSKEVPQDLTKAYGYYLTATKVKHRNALTALERVVNTSNNSAWNYELGEIRRLIFIDLMSATQWYKKAADQKHEQALKQLREIASQNGDIAYMIAQVYENDFEEKRTTLNLALEFYQLALQSDHAATQKRVEELAKAGNAEAQCMIGDYCFSHRKPLDAAKWWMKAAEQKHEKASRLLLQTSFTADVYFQIGALYEEREWVPPSLLKALPFYTKADQLNYPQASFRLGQLNEKGSQEVPQNLQKACQHYVSASKHQHQEAVVNLERLVSSSPSPAWSYELAEIYRLTIKNSASAAKWYKKAADQKHELALKPLREIASQNGDIAYMIAQAYEKDFEEKPTTSNLSFEFYGLALRHNHATSRQHLKELASAGNGQAQYILVEYYQGQREMSEAVKWCLKAADQKYAPAIRYLNQTRFSADIYFQIATAYEHGNDIAQDWLQAFQFYVKANDAGCARSSFWLAQWYQTDPENEQQDDEKAFDYYMKALRQGCRDAVGPLERLGEERSSQKQKELGDLCKGWPLYDDEEASQWYTKVAETDRRNQQLAVTLSRSIGYGKSRAHQKYSESTSLYTSSSSSSLTRGAFGSGGGLFPSAQRVERQEQSQSFQNLDSPS